MMKYFHCTNIKFDESIEEAFSAPAADLPTEMLVIIEDEISDEDDIDEILADAISDETGWCVESFLYEESASAPLK